MEMVFVSMAITSLVVLGFVKKLFNDENINAGKKPTVENMLIIPFIVFLGLYFILSSIWNIYSNSNFDLDNENKYIIYCKHMGTNSEKTYHYDIDFNKNKIVYVNNYESKCVYFKKYKNELSNFINEIMNDEANLMPLRKNEIGEYVIEDNMFSFYYIKTYDDKVYYVKSKEKLEQLEKLLSDIENNNDSDIYLYYIPIIVVGICVVRLILYYIRYKKMLLK